MRIGAVALLLATSIGCSGGFFQQYEYDEEMYLALDGSATIYVHASLAALNALRGAAFDTSPNARVDREAVRAFFTSPVTRVTRPITQSRRNRRRFVHVAVDVDDLHRLGEAPAFSWSSYRFERVGEGYELRQQIGASAGKDVGGVTWTGKELVAFRVHVPSKIVDHNAGAGNLRRGNILVWEQPLADRRLGAPLTLETHMEPQSILYRTLWLFGATIVVVAFTFAAAIWLIVRRGAKPVPQT
jgi:hypothetical protein